jgi:regulator of replication initiation timing
MVAVRNTKVNSRALNIKITDLVEQAKQFQSKIKELESEVNSLTQENIELKEKLELMIKMADKKEIKQKPSSRKQAKQKPTNKD